MEIVTIEVLPPVPAANPDKLLSRPDKQKTAAKITTQATQSIIQAAKPNHHPAVSQKNRPQDKIILANSSVQSQPIAQLSVGKRPEPVASGSKAQQHSISTEGERKLVRQHLEAFKFYPGSARRRGIEGHVDVAFTLAQNGTATDVAVLQGSGHSVLDQAAMETVYRAQPFPVHTGAFRFRLKFKRL